MLPPSVEEFRSTLKTFRDQEPGCGDEIYSYWNNQSINGGYCNREELLHIKRKADGFFYLEIGNIVQDGSLEELEEKLFAWANDEGWFEEARQG